MILISRLKAGIHEQLSLFVVVHACESVFQACFRRMADYCDRIQLVKITDELNSKDFVCKMEEAEDEIKTNEEMDAHHKLQRLRQKPSKNIPTTDIYFENLPEWKGLLLNG